MVTERCGTRLEMVVKMFVYRLVTITYISHDCISGDQSLVFVVVVILGYLLVQCSDNLLCCNFGN